jgi:hypothetical protein
MCQRRILLNNLLSVPFHLILLISLCLSITVYGDAKSECNALTGGIHTRVVWREGGHQISGGGNAIKGFDSKTGEITTIWNEKCVKPVICAGGHKVLLTSGDYKVWVVDWDGTNKKQLATGSVSDGWCDPKTGKNWAIFRGSGTGTGGGVHRICIDDPTQKVQIYGGQEGHSVYPWFQISADGTIGASFFPWKKGGFLDIASGKVNFVTGGCWSGMASDNSYNWFHLDGSHTGLAAFNKSKKLGGFKAMPPIKGGQIYCPRAAEGPKEGGLYLTLSGGYPGYNKNGNGVEVFVGKLNSGYNGVSKWARITNNGVPDHHPSVWIGVESATDLSKPNNPLTIPTKQLSVKMVGSRTFELQIRHKEPFEIEIVNPVGAVIKKSSGFGPEQFRWTGQTAGIYLIRLKGKNSEIKKRIALW